MKGWKKRKIKIWHLLIAFIVLTLASVLALRHNNLKMVKLRDQVIQADKTGKNLDKAITNLNDDVFKHMNTTTVKPVELVNSYNRAVKATLQASTKTSKSKDVYQKAAASCERQGVPLTSIAECAANYAISHHPDLNLKSVSLPDKSLFIYSFASPLWTPDLAGWLIVLTLITGVWLIFRIVEFITARLVLRSRLKKQF